VRREPTTVLPLPSLSPHRGTTALGAVVLDAFLSGAFLAARRRWRKQAERGS